MYQKYCELRDQKKWSDYKVAKLTGIGQSTFTDWKNGRSVPKTEKLIKIAELFEVPITYFTEETPNEPKNTLSDDEQELLQLYREMPIENRTELLGHARFIQSTLKKTGSSKVG